MAKGPRRGSLGPLGGDSRACRRHRAERGQEALCDGGPGGDVPGGLAGDVDRVWGTWTGGELQADEQRERSLTFRPRSWAGVEPGRGGETQLPPPGTQRQPCAHLASPAPRSPGLGPQRLWPAGFSVQSGPFVLASSAHPRVGPANPLSPFSLTHWAGGSARRCSTRGSDPTTRSGAGPGKALGHPLLPREFCAQAAEEAGSHQRQS